MKSSETDGEGEGTSLLMDAQLIHTQIPGKLVKNCSPYNLSFWVQRHYFSMCTVFNFSMRKRQLGPSL